MPLLLTYDEERGMICLPVAEDEPVTIFDVTPLTGVTAPWPHRHQYNFTTIIVTTTRFKTVSIRHLKAISWSWGWRSCSTATSPARSEELPEFFLFLIIIVKKRFISSDTEKMFLTWYLTLHKQVFHEMFWNILARKSNLFHPKLRTLFWVETHLRVIDLVLLALLIRLSLDAAEDWPCRTGDPWLACHEKPYDDGWDQIGLFTCSPNISMMADMFESLEPQPSRSSTRASSPFSPPSPSSTSLTLNR